MNEYTDFKDAFQGDLVTPAHTDEYPQAIARWAMNAQRKAAIVAFVKSNEDVALAIAYARRSKLPIAIRGGGHSASAASSAEGGLVIDLSRYIRDVRVDVDEKVAYVGGGALWRDVDGAAIKHGLATVGGTVDHTGVGGLILGGGFGYLSGAHGLSIDSLVQATVVTADGSILTANAASHPDLFWGIAGGGSNFGVVTEFVMRLYPQRKTVYAGLLVFPPGLHDEILSATTTWWKEGAISEKEAMFLILGRGPTGEPCVTLLLFYNGNESEGRENFKAFIDLKPIMDTTAEIPYNDLNTLQNPMSGHGQCRYLKGAKQLHPQPEASKRVFELTQTLSDPASSKVSLTVVSEFYSMSKITSVPASTASFVRNGWGNAASVLTWDTKDDSPETLKYAKESALKIHEILTEKGDKGLTGYANFYSEDSEAPTETSIHDKSKAAFGDNYARLREVKKTYDPELVFSKWFPIEPAA